MILQFGGTCSLVGFYGISTIVGYSMANPLYTYILSKSKVGDLSQG